MLEEVFEKGLGAIRKKKTPENITYDTLMESVGAGRAAGRCGV
jgi:hypothetical protein